MTKATRVISWAMSVSTAVWLAAPTASAATPVYQYEWVSQSGTISADGLAHEYTGVTPGQTINMSLTLKNRSGVTIKGTDALGAIPAGKQVQVGAWGIGSQTPTQDGTPSFLDLSSFVLNNNRFVYYNGADVPNGGTMTFTWTIKMASTLANGTYKLYVKPVDEYRAWTRQWKNGVTLPSYNSDIFTQFVVGSGTSTPATGGLSVNLASGTPAATSIADGAATNFTKITLTPATGASVSITKILVTRGGLSTDSQAENVKMIRVSDGVQVGGTAGGFNALHQADIFFSPAMVLTSPTDFYLRAGVVDASTAGNTISLGIASNSDITSNATSVTGAPVTGNLMTIVSLTIGSIQMGEFGSISDSTPDVGDINVLTNTFQLTAGSTEDVYVEQISALKVGTAASDDTVNIELWNDTTNTTVGTVAAWNDNRATWNISPALKIAQGATVRFSIRVDVVDGSGLNFNTDVIDGSDVLVIAKGSLYGYYLTPTIASAWGGQGDNVQTINAGALTISKSASSAPTGKIAVANDQTLGTWDFDDRGEDIRVSALSVDLAGTAADTAQERLDNFKSARIYDETGNIVAGPVDGSADGATALNRELDFTQTFVVPVGIHKYTLKVNIQTGAADSETVSSTITAAGDVTAKGIRTNTSITVGISGAALNTMTVGGVKLVSTTLTTPAARSVVIGAQDVDFANFNFDAGTSGEDVRITAIKVSVSTAAEADPDAIINMEIWADLTSANSPRGDVFETNLSAGNAEQPTGLNDPAADVTYTLDLSPALTVTKGNSIKCAFIADIQAGGFTAAADDDTVLVQLGTVGAMVGSDITAIGVNSGTSLDTAPTLTGQLMTVVSAGTLTLTTDATSPLAQIIVGGATMQKVGVFRIAANNVENIELDKVIFETALTGSYDVQKWTAYSNRDANGALVGGNGVLLGYVAPISATTFTITVPDHTSTVPANGYALITIYADASTVDGVTAINGNNIQVGIDGGGTDADQCVGTGLGSGGTANVTAFTDLDAATNRLMKSKLSVSVASTSPSGALIPGVLTLIAEFAFTADAAADVSFRQGSDEQVIVSVDTSIYDVSDSGTDEVEIVRKATGDILDTDTSSAGGDGDWNATAETSTFTYNFSTTALTVAAGTTEVIQVFADTDDLNTVGDSIRAWFAATAANITYATEGTNSDVALGDIIARGNIRANILQKP